MPSDRSPESGYEAADDIGLAIMWWIMRLAVPVSVVWTLWRILPATVTVTAAIILLLISLVFLSPWDLPRRPVAVPGVLVVLWDLVLVAAMLGVWVAHSHPHGQMYVAGFFTLVLVGGRLPVWAALTGPPVHAARIRVPLRMLVVATAAVLTASLLSPLYRDGASHVLECAGLVSLPGGGDTWEDAEPAGPEPEEEHPLLGEALWKSHEWEQVAGGHGDTVTFAVDTAEEQGFAVRASDDGRVLWHVDPQHLPSSATRSPAFHPSRVHQVGETVLAEFRGPTDDAADPERSWVVGYDAADGRTAWCAAGVWGVRTTPDVTDRFVARVGSSDAGWALHEAAGGSEIAPLPLDGDPGSSDEDALPTRTHLSNGRVTIHSTRGLSSYRVGTGSPVTTVPDVQEMVAKKHIHAVAHVDDITVVSFKPVQGGTFEHNHERYGVAAYGPGGEYLWDSVGTGPLEVGGPLVGSGFGECLGPFPGFGGHFLVEGAVLENKVMAVRAADGTIAWIDGDDHSFTRCSQGARVVSESLFINTGETVGPEGPVSEPLPSSEEGERTLVFAGNGVGTQYAFRSPVVFHAHP